MVNEQFDLVEFSFACFSEIETRNDEIHNDNYQPTFIGLISQRFLQQEGRITGSTTHY